jgi:tetratricopeptide (TPR) repeat protein
MALKRTVLLAIFIAGASASTPAAAKWMVGPPLAHYARVHHSIGTSSATAQAYFDQGLTLLYAFSRSAARRAFQNAAAADPRLAMAYWGVALSFGSNINEAQDAASERTAYSTVQRALALSRGTSPSERAYIKALAARFSSASHPDFNALGIAYHDAMRALTQRYPQDLDAATLYAESGMDLRPWDLYASDGAPRKGTAEILATLESVLSRDSGHIGGNHFYIHATEASLRPERALASARRLASLHFEPAAAHLTHMPAHTFARTGYYHAAVQSNSKATQRDRMYLAGEGHSDREASMYYDHNLTFLAFAAEMEGNFAAARETLARLRSDGAQVPALFVLLRFERWNDLLALSQPKPDPAEPMRVVMWHFGRGMAFAATGNPRAANRERKAMYAIGSRLRVPSLAGWNNSSDALVGVTDNVLAAKIAGARRDYHSALALLRAAVRKQDELIYIEPPDWYYPVRESLGGMLLRQGRFAEAAQVFRDDLTRNPRNPRSLFGLAKALAASGQANDARRVQLQFEQAWKHADIRLTPQAL